MRLAFLLLCASCYRTTPRVYAPIFGPGPVTNLGTDQADTNAMAHAGWALAIPLGGHLCAGRKGMWAAGLAWIGFSLVSEVAFHAPDQPGQGYASEFRTDLLSRIVPTALLLTLDALLEGHL